MSHSRERMWEDDLIAAIQERPAIWNKKHAHHSHNHILGKLWNEVAKKVGEDKTKCKSRWKSLKQKYTEELSDMPKLKSGSAAINYSSAWPFFNSMAFMKSMIEPAESTGNSDSFNSFFDNEPDEYEIEKELYKSSTSRKDSAGGSNFSQVSQVNSNHMSNNSTQEIVDNEDMTFCHTLLPYMRVVTGRCKLELRSEIMKLVKDAVFECDKMDKHEQVTDDTDGTSNNLFDKMDNQEQVTDDPDDIQFIDWRIIPNDKTRSSPPSCDRIKSIKTEIKSESIGAQRISRSSNEIVKHEPSFGEIQVTDTSAVLVKKELVPKKSATDFQLPNPVRQNKRYRQPLQKSGNISTTSIKPEIIDINDENEEPIDYKRLKTE